MRGRCRFLRTTRGRSYFAQVALEIHPGGGTVAVVDALPDQVNADEGEVNRVTAPTWVAAALGGIQASLGHARQAGVLSAGCRAALTELVGSPVDTREDVVRCAAGLAVWDALGSTEPAPEVEFNGQGWVLVFPAGIPGPVQRMSR